jgi:hypothetical protein
MAVAIAPPRGLQIVRRDAWVPEELRAKIASYEPKTHLGRLFRDCLHYLPAEQAAALIDSLCRIVVIESDLVLRAFVWNDRRGYREVQDYGVVCRKVVTNNGVAHIVDAHDNTVELENLNFHAIGTGSTAEAAGDSALVTELTTEYTGNVRATGTQTQPSANIYRSTATNTLDSGTPILREHGLMSQAATGGGVLFDRSVFAAITLDGTAGDALQSQYSVTYTAGS